MIEGLATGTPVAGNEGMAIATDRSEGHRSVVGLVMAGLLLVIVDVFWQGHDLLPDLIGALLLLWALPALALAPRSRALLQGLAWGLVATKILVAAEAGEHAARALAALLVDASPGPADRLVALGRSALPAARALFEAGLVMAMLLALARAARRANRPVAVGLAAAALLLQLAVTGWYATTGVAMGSPWWVVMVLALLQIAGVVACALSLPPSGRRPRPNKTLVWSSLGALSAWGLALLSTAYDQRQVAAELETVRRAPILERPALLLRLARHRPEADQGLVAIGYMGTKELPDLTRVWQRQVQLWPTSPAVLQNAARFAQLTGDLAGAEQRYRALQRLAPASYFPLWELGEAYLQRARRTTGPRQAELARQAAVRFEQVRAEQRAGSGPKGRPTLGQATIGACWAAYLLADYATLERLANELLAIAQDWSNDPTFYGLQFRGLVALHAGDLAQAKDDLLASGRLENRSPVRSTFGPDVPLAQALLDGGEREVVLLFLDDLVHGWPRGRDRVAQWQEAIRRDETPKLDRFAWPPKPAP
jgi:hypothetical protein